MSTIEQKVSSLVAEEYKRRSAKTLQRVMTYSQDRPPLRDDFKGLCEGIANVMDRANTAHSIALAYVNAQTEQYGNSSGPDSRLRQALWSFIRSDGRELAAYAADARAIYPDAVAHGTGKTARAVAAVIENALSHFPEVRQ